MLCKLVIIENTDSVEEDWNLYRSYSYLEYYLCDISSNRAIIFKNKEAYGMVGNKSDLFNIDDDFDYEKVLSNMKEFEKRHQRWEQKYQERRKKVKGKRKLEYFDRDNRLPPPYRIPVVKDIEVNEDFFNQIFEHYKAYTTEQRRFQDKIRNLFDVE
ncbi:hypothetical protein KY312_01545 [Candidatus Woesearchaeota archaeon]|nr:hypothetical protein [Candidatus Woesearchaeota archaeon]